MAPSRISKACKIKERVVTISRTSSLTNADGDSTSRQKRAAQHAAIQSNMPSEMHITHVGVSGTVALRDRPRIQNLVKNNKAKGAKTTLVFENESRLARGMQVQMDALKWAEEEGVDLIHSQIPDLWTSKDLLKRCIAHVLGALSELDWATKVATLKSGRDAAHTVTKKRSLKGNTKVEGRRNFKDLLC